MVPFLFSFYFPSVPRFLLLQEIQWTFKKTNGFNDPKYHNILNVHTNQLGWDLLGRDGLKLLGKPRITGPQFGLMGKVGMQGMKLGQDFL